MSQGPPNPSAANMPESQVRLSDRLEIATRWASAASWVAKRTGDNEATGLLDFLDQKGALAVPFENGYRLYYPNNGSQRPHSEHVFLAPILRSDARFLPADDGRLDVINSTKGTVARYNEGSQTVLIPPTRLPRTVRGLVFLHELKHAWLDINQLVDRNKPGSDWDEEAEVFIFEFRLLSLLGGAAYAGLLNDYVTAIHPRRGRNPKATRANFDHLRPAARKQFERLGVTGEASTRILSGVQGFYAFWEYAQRHFDDPKRHLAAFIKYKYRGVGQGGRD